MFRYDNSLGQSQPKEKQIKHVSQIRKVTYINPNPDPKKKDKPIISEGWEIVKEIVVDPTVPLTMAADVVDQKTVEFVPPKKTPKPEYNREERNGQD